MGRLRNRHRGSDERYLRLSYQVSTDHPIRPTKSISRDLLRAGTSLILDANGAHGYLGKDLARRLLAIIEQVFAVEIRGREADAGGDEGADQRCVADAVLEKEPASLLGGAFRGGRLRRFFPGVFE